MFYAMPPPLYVTCVSVYVFVYSMILYVDQSEITNRPTVYHILVKSNVMWWKKAEVLINFNVKICRKNTTSRTKIIKITRRVRYQNYKLIITTHPIVFHSHSFCVWKYVEVNDP